MKTLILVGSGHNNSRSYKLANEVAQVFKDQGIQYLDVLDLCQLNIHECLGCEYCLSHQNQCIIDDQMQPIYKLISESDVLLFISPVYFSNIPATLKKVIDRCQLFFNLKNKASVKPKKFMAIHVGGAPNYKDQFEAFKLSYKVLLPDFKADLIDFIGISNSDRTDFLEDKELMDDIKMRVKKLITEEKENA